MASLVPLSAYQEGQKDQRQNEVWGVVKPLTSITLTTSSSSSELYLDKPKRAFVMSNVCSQGGCGEVPFKSAEREVYGGRGKREGETMEHEKKQQASRRGEKRRQ